MLILVNMGQLTSAKIAPYLIALSTDFSTDPLITGVYSFSNPLAILRVHGATSVELPPTPTLDDGDGQLGANVRTVSFAANSTSRVQLYFPMTTASILLNQICTDSW